MGNPSGGVKTEWVDQGYKWEVYKNPGEIQCEIQKDVDEECVNRNIWGDLGYWTPVNTCQDVVKDLIRKCNVRIPSTPFLWTGGF